MIVRAAEDGCFTVVGPAYVHGLMDSEALLGPIPHPWRVQQIQHEGRFSLRFLNTETNNLSVEDPRLPALKSEWQRIYRYYTADDPLYFAEFRNVITGQVMNSDPRLLPEALESRGVDLRTFTLK